MTGQGTPESLLSSIRALEPLVRQHSDEAERLRRLSFPVVQAFTDAGIFRMCVPLTLGGLEVAPLTFYQVIEEVSRLDGSTGWCTFIGGAGGVLGAYLANQTTREMFGSDLRVIIAGSVAPAGKATVIEGGYRVSGRWPYASGIQHCTWLLGFCHVLEREQLRLTTTGIPEVRAVFIRPAQATILEETWQVSGLAGTGSHDFLVEDIFVPNEYTWMFGPEMQRGSHFQGLLYHFPLAGLLRLPTSAVALGIAQGAIDACKELAHTKRTIFGAGVLRDHPLFQAQIAEAVALVRSARSWLHAAVEQAWISTVNSKTASFDERADLVLSAVNAVDSSAKAVQRIYTLCGAAANYRQSPLQRALRDVHAVTQHVGVAPQQYEDAGRMILNLKPLQESLLW